MSTNYFEINSTNAITELRSVDRALNLRRIRVLVEARGGAALHPADAQVRVPLRGAVRAPHAHLHHDDDVLHLLPAHHALRIPLLPRQVLRRPPQPPLRLRPLQDQPAGPLHRHQLLRYGRRHTPGDGELFLIIINSTQTDYHFPRTVLHDHVHYPSEGLTEPDEHGLGVRWCPPVLHQRILGADVVRYLQEA